MHGCTTEKHAVATYRRPHGQQTQDRSGQRADASRSLVARRAQHGAGMADSAQPTAGQREQTGRATADVENLCSARSRSLGLQEEPRGKKPVEAVGEPSRHRGQSLHLQEQADVVSLPRPTGAVSTKNVMCLLEYQAYRCALTGRELTPETSSLDHIVPIRCGGEHAIENAQVLHQDVNRAKGSLTNEQFVGMCREVVRWNERHDARKESQ